VVLGFDVASRHQYQLLTALKELIVYCGGSTAAVPLTSIPFAQILPALIIRAADSERIVRNVVAECLGYIAILDFELMRPVFVMMTSNTGDKITLCTVAVALRHTLSRAAVKVDADALFGVIETIIGDDDLPLREETLRMLNGGLHKNPSLMESRGRLRELIVPRLITTLAYKNIIEIDLGNISTQRKLNQFYLRLTYAF
jgi:hypothetical protein